MEYPFNIGPPRSFGIMWTLVPFFLTPWDCSVDAPLTLTRSHSHLLTNTSFTSVWVQGVDDSDMWPAAGGQSFFSDGGTHFPVYDHYKGRQNEGITLHPHSHLSTASTNLLALAWVIQPLLPTHRNTELIIAIRFDLTSVTKILTMINVRLCIHYIYIIVY